MTWVGTLQGKAGEGLVVAARSSQALVIESLDRAVGVGVRRTVLWWNRVGRFQPESVCLMLDDPAEFVDDGYEVLQRLISLHREFAQRLFEVVDPRDLSVRARSDAGTGHVLPFPKRASTS
jgi:hypothetical protein